MRSMFAVVFSILGGLLGCAAPPVAVPVAPPTTATATPSAPPAVVPDPLAAKIDPLFAEATRGRAPGCAVGVFRAGEAPFTKGYGYADLEHDAPITDTTIFYAASLAKQFTAAAIALLVLDGKLRLSDDVRTYVPELPTYGSPITIDELLHHTSGLRDYETLNNLDGTSDEDVTTEADAFFLLTHQRALNFPSGTKFSYSNSGYVIAAIIVRRLAGMSFPEFMKARVFEPLGMHQTHMRDDHAELVPGRAVGYVVGGDHALRLGLNGLEMSGDGGLYTTVADLARWDANFYAPKVGGEAMLELLRTPGTLVNGAPVAYGLGLHLDRVGAVARESHNGINGGYRANLTRFPERRLAVALLCNASSFDSRALATAVAGVVDAEVGAALAADERKRSASTPQASPVHLSEEAIAALVGLYVEPRTMRARRLRAEGGRVWLSTSVLDDAGYELVATDARTLYVKGKSTRYTFEPATPRHAARLVRSAYGEPESLFDRTTPWLPGTTALADFAGRYASDELPRDLAIVVRDGALFEGAWGRRDDARLRPLTRDSFVGPNEGGDMTIQFERDPRGHVIGATIGILGDESEAAGVRLQRRAWR